MKSALYNIVFLVVLLCLPAWSKGRQSESSRSKKSGDATTIPEIKKTANEVLDDVDKGVHKGLGAAKKGTNDSLKAIDRAVHDVIGTSK